MSKTNIKNLRRANLIDRGEVYAHYVAKYFNLFLNRFKFEGDITDREAAFIMRQFWSVGATKWKARREASNILEGSPYSRPMP